MSYARGVLLIAICLACGSAARWGIENWGMFGHIPALAAWLALILCIIRPARAAGG